MSLFLMESRVSFSIVPASQEGFISSGKGNHTNEKLEAKKDYHLPPFRIGGVNLRGAVDVLPGLSSRLLLVTEVGHEELGQGNVSC